RRSPRTRARPWPRSREAPPPRSAARRRRGSAFRKREPKQHDFNAAQAVGEAGGPLRTITVTSFLLWAGCLTRGKAGRGGGERGGEGAEGVVLVAALELRGDDEGARAREPRLDEGDGARRLADDVGEQPVDGGGRLVGEGVAGGGGDAGQARDGGRERRA